VSDPGAGCVGSALSFTLCTMETEASPELWHNLRYYRGLMPEYGNPKKENGRY